ncbi:MULTISPECIES: type 1 fimbrial protein [Kosakonia]|uniref:type 1 fimbrial protein n=1 Tax=Kosakonia TaxID=1330547 RepID=UPI000AD80CAB|nr:MULTISPECIES: type 1 fimbrial protein [Kosakonia]
MKKIIALSALMAALASANAMAVDSNLTFTGSVTSSTCTMNASDATKTLVIPDISSAALLAAGATSQSASTTINFSSCPASISNVKIIKGETTGSLYTGYSATETNRSVPASGTATGLNLILFAGPSQTSVPVNGSVISNQNFAVTNGSASIPVGVSAAANANNQAATAGTYSSSFTLTFAWS